MVQALLDGNVYTWVRRICEPTKTGSVPCRATQAHPPIVLDERGWRLLFSRLVWQVLELNPGMAAVQVGTKEDLPDVIRSVIEAVKFGELDIQIEDVAKKGTADLRLKA